jgi:hypothetical protein
MSVFSDEQLAEIKSITAAAVAAEKKLTAAAIDGLKAKTDGLTAAHSQLRVDFEDTLPKGGVTADDENSLDNGTRDNQAFHRKNIPQHGW